MLGMAPDTDFAELIRNGAVIVDVRSKGEYASGHFKGSVNIPLDQLEYNLSKLKKDDVIITCCASGMRSGVAKNHLINQGFKKVYNGGGWASLNKLMK